MHLFLLTLHNITRWLVIVFGLLAIIRSVSGWVSQKDRSTGDDRMAMLYTMSLDIQVLIGLILYVYPGIYTRMAFSDFGAAMRSAEIRFFTVEHILILLIAVALAHIGRAMVKKAPGSLQKQRRAAIWLGLSFLAILAAIPWPFLAYGRPLLRLFGLEF